MANKSVNKSDEMKQHAATEELQQGKDVDTQNRDVSGNATATTPDRGEQAAQEAIDKRDNSDNTELKTVVKDGNSSVVEKGTKDKSDNGKTYKDPRIVPSDTNAPDAGLTPDGRRIAS
jgi:hypothetical protein